MPAGKQYTILRQRIFIAPLGTVLPALSLDYGAAWPTGWELVENTEEGAMVTTSVPQADIDSDENGNIGVEPEGGDQVNIAFASMTPSMNLLALLSQFKKKAIPAVTGGTPMPAADVYALSEQGTRFMVGVEGEAQAGSLESEATLVRVLGYKVQQTEETEISFRTRGGQDSIVKPAAQLRCLKHSLQTSQLTNTGMTLEDLDEKFNFIVIK